MTKEPSGCSLHLSEQNGGLSSGLPRTAVSLTPAQAPGLRSPTWTLPPQRGSERPPPPGGDAAHTCQRRRAAHLSATWCGGPQRCRQGRRAAPPAPGLPAPEGAPSPSRPWGGARRQHRGLPLRRCVPPAQATATSTCACRRKPRDGGRDSRHTPDPLGGLALTPALSSVSPGLSLT